MLLHPDGPKETGAIKNPITGVIKIAVRPVKNAGKSHYNRMRTNSHRQPGALLQC